MLCVFLLIYNLVGVCFPVAQWNKLKELIPDIDEAIDALQKK